MKSQTPVKMAKLLLSEALAGDKLSQSLLLAVMFGPVSQGPLAEYADDTSKPVYLRRVAIELHGEPLI